MSVELRSRYPSLRNSDDLTKARSVLVSNRNLGAALARRYGAEATLDFFPDASTRFREHVEALAALPAPSLAQIVRQARRPPPLLL